MRNLFGGQNEAMRLLCWSWDFILMHLRPRGWCSYTLAVPAPQCREKSPLMHKHVQEHMPPAPTHTPTLTLTMGCGHNWVSLVLSPTVSVPSPSVSYDTWTHLIASDCMGVLQLFSARLGLQNALLTGLPRGYCAPCSPAPCCFDALPRGPIPLTGETA